MAPLFAPARRLDDSILRNLPASLREPQEPVRAILTGWLLSLVGSIVLAALSQALAPDFGTPRFPTLPPEVLLFLMVVFAPVVETLIMALVLEVLLRLRVPATAAILLSAVGWGIAHSTQAAAWGLVIWWPFLIFSTLYVTWSRRSVWAGVGVAASTHALQNLIPVLLLLRSG